MVIEKKGAEETNALVWVVLALVVVGIFGLVYYKFYNQASTGFELLPGEVAQANQVCGAIAGLNDKSLICGDFKNIDIGGKKQYASCGYLANLIPESDRQEWANDLGNCDSQYAKDYCNDLMVAQGDSFDGERINGVNYNSECIEPADE